MYDRTNNVSISTHAQEVLWKIQQRQKQIYFGMVTTGYWNYQANYLGAESQPFPTPKIDPEEPKRVFDRKIHEWRRSLHAWDDKPGPAGYDKTTVWQKNILPAIERARQAVLALTKSLPQSEAVQDSSDSDEFHNDFREIIYSGPHR